MAARWAPSSPRSRRGSGARRRLRALCCALAALAALAVAPGAAGETGEGSSGLIVAFEPGTPAVVRHELLAANGVEPEETVEELGLVVGAVAADRSPAAIEALRADPRVRYVEADGIARSMLTPTDPGFAAADWVYLSTELPGAWSATTGAGSVVVAILDSGVDSSHPDLAGAVVAGTSYVGGSTTDTSDVLGHGTLVAGTLAARLDGAGAVGACPACSVMPVRVLDASDRALWSDVASGIVWAADHGADVVNVSLAGTTGSETVRAAIDYAAGRDVLVVMAAGNASSTDPSACGAGGCGGYPAAFAPESEAALSVAATGPDDRLASFSNHGAGWVEIAAPGCVQTTARGGGLTGACGTSFATPLVAGAAGLLLAHDPTLSAAQLAGALTSSADRLPGLDVASGRLDAYAALRAVGYAGGPPASSAPPQISGAPREGELLTASAGSWLGSPASLEIAWARCDTGGRSCVHTGATGAGYAPGAADVGATLRVVVTATGATGTGTAVSAPTAVVEGRTAAAPPGASGGGGAGGGASPVDVAVGLAASPAGAEPGSTLVYRATASLNPGSGPAAKVVLSITLPDGTAFAEARATRGPGCTRSGAALTCDLDFLQQGLVAEVLVTVTVAGPGPLVAEARAETTPGDARPGDNHAALTVGVRTAAAGAAGARHSADAVVGPALRGAARVGRRLTVLPGTGWKGGGPHRFVVRWQRCRLTGGLRCVTLGARRGRLLALTRADVGMRLRAVIFAVSSDGIRQRRVTRPSAPVRNRARAVAVRSTAVARPLPVRRSG